MPKHALVLAACLLPLGAAAQNGTAIAAQVEGLVTISHGQNVGLLEPGTALPEGARVVTGSSGTTLLRVGPGCEITLRPNQSLLVSAGRSCPDLIAAIEQVAPPGGTQVAGTPWLATPQGLATTALAAGLVGVVARAGRSGPLSGQ